MKKFYLTVALVFMLIVPAYSQYVYWGPTIEHRTDVTDIDRWFGYDEDLQTAPTSDSLELKGYNSVRIDADVTSDVADNAVSIVVNLTCSNDSLWVSGDAITFTGDGYVDEYLQGCADYHVNVDSISAGDSITIYVTPFNR